LIVKNDNIFYIIKKDIYVSMEEEKLGIFYFKPTPTNYVIENKTIQRINNFLIEIENKIGEIPIFLKDDVDLYNKLMDDFLKKQKIDRDYQNKCCEIHHLEMDIIFSIEIILKEVETVEVLLLDLYD